MGSNHSLIYQRISQWKCKHQSFPVYW